MDIEQEILGVVVPMASPFTINGTVDIQAARKLAGYLVNGGAIPFLQGTTGEGLSIPNQERLRFTEVVVDECGDSSPVVAAITHHAFGDAAMLGNSFFELGVDAVAAHLPTFYPMSDDQVVTYFENLADAVGGPLLIYNIPQMVGRSIPLEVVEQLSYHRRIVGMKDSEDDITRQEQAINRCAERDDFIHLVGCAAHSARGVDKGAAGIVPSVGNIVPHLYKQLYDAAVAGDMEQANRLQRETDAIGQLYQEGRNLSESLAALKAILSYYGLCEPHMLPPVTACPPEEVQEILTRISSNEHLEVLTQKL